MGTDPGWCCRQCCHRPAEKTNRYIFSLFFFFALQFSNRSKAWTEGEEDWDVVCNLIMTVPVQFLLTMTFFDMQNSDFHDQTRDSKSTLEVKDGIKYLFNTFWIWNIRVLCFMYGCRDRIFSKLKKCPQCLQGSGMRGWRWLMFLFLPHITPACLAAMPASVADRTRSTAQCALSAFIHSPSIFVLDSHPPPPPKPPCVCVCMSHYLSLSLDTNQLGSTAILL